MKVNREILQQTARLSRLDFEAIDEKKMLKDLNQILDWVAILEEIDTENTVPLIHLSEEVNVFRKDEVNGMFVNQVKTLQNAPVANESYFKVPKVLD